jgi:hypothetical protein
MSNRILKAGMQWGDEAITILNNLLGSALPADSASAISAAITALNLGDLATLDSVAAAQIDNNAVGTTEIADDAVTYAKIQTVTDARLLGRSAGSNGDAQEITVGSGLSLAAGALTATATPNNAFAITVTNGITLTSATDIQLTAAAETFDVGSKFASNAWTPVAGAIVIIADIDFSSTNGVDGEQLFVRVYKNAAQVSNTRMRRNTTGSQHVQALYADLANGTDVYTIYAHKGGAGDGSTGADGVVSGFALA